MKAGISNEVMDFIWEDLVYRHRVFGRLSIDKGPENKAITKSFTRKYRIKRVQISAYNSKAAGAIKRVYKDVINALSKIGKGLKR